MVGKCSAEVSQTCGSAGFQWWLWECGWCLDGAGIVVVFFLIGPFT